MLRWQCMNPTTLLLTAVYIVSRWDRILVFGALNLAALALFVICFTLFPVLSIRPRKFAILYVRIPLSIPSLVRNFYARWCGQMVMIIESPRHRRLRRQSWHFSYSPRLLFASYQSFVDPSPKQALARLRTTNKVDHAAIPALARLALRPDLYCTNYWSSP